MDHSHPEVLKASAAFDELLNAYLRHQGIHRRRAAPLGSRAIHSPSAYVKVGGR